MGSVYIVRYVNHVNTSCTYLTVLNTWKLYKVSLWLLFLSLFRCWLDVVVKVCFFVVSVVRIFTVHYCLTFQRWQMWLFDSVVIIIVDKANNVLFHLSILYFLFLSVALSLKPFKIGSQIYSFMLKKIQWFVQSSWSQWSFMTWRNNIQSIWLWCTQS